MVNRNISYDLDQRLSNAVFMEINLDLLSVLRSGDLIKITFRVKADLNRELNLELNWELKDELHNINSDI